MALVYSVPTVQYAQATIDRAERAVRCTPFQLHLFTALYQGCVALRDIAGDAGVAQNYTYTPLPELIAENHLNWLLQVGVLRREVDGQGITDSFRLTPLGRQLLQAWQTAGFQSLPKPTWGDRLLDFAAHWLRLP